MNINSQLVGISWMIVHCFLISVISVLVKHTSEEFHILQVVFFHNAFAFIFLLPWVLKKGLLESIATKKINLHLIRSILAVLSITLYFYAFTIITLTEARAIALSGPLISSLLAIIFLKETMGYHRIIALILGLIGAIIIIQPGTIGFSFASLLVVAALCMWSVIEIIIKKLGKTESMITQLFYLMGFTTIFSIPGAIIFWKTPENISQWLLLMSIGAVLIINCFAVFKAFTQADITTLMPFDFSGMIFTAIIAFFVFGEIVTIPVLCGSIIIMLSSVYMVRREAKKQRVL